MCMYVFIIEMLSSCQVCVCCVYMYIHSYRVSHQTAIGPEYQGMLFVWKSDVHIMPSMVCTQATQLLCILLCLFLNQAHAWLLDIIFVQNVDMLVCMHACMFVCGSASEDINNQWCDMVWCRPCVIGWTSLQLFPISFFIHLISIQWMVVALATQVVVHTWQRRWNWCLTSHITEVVYRLPSSSNKMGCFSYKVNV